MKDWNGPATIGLSIIVAAAVISFNMPKGAPVINVGAGIEQVTKPEPVVETVMQQIKRERREERRENRLDESFDVEEYRKQLAQERRDLRNAEAAKQVENQLKTMAAQEDEAIIAAKVDASVCAAVPFKRGDWVRHKGSTAPRYVVTRVWYASDKKRACTVGLRNPENMTYGETFADLIEAAP